MAAPPLAVPPGTPVAAPDGFVSGAASSNTTRWTTPAVAKKRSDPIMTTAWTEVAVGGAFTLAGAIAVGVATGERSVCAEITGCFTAREPELTPLRFGAFSQIGRAHV